MKSKKRQKNKILRNALAIATLALATLGVASVQTDVMQSKESVASSAPTYAVGDLYVREDNAQIQIGENYVAATSAIVRWPDGNVYELNDFLLQQCGVYEIVYFATYNGEKVSQTATFIVTDGEETDVTAPVLSMEKGTAFNVALNHEVTLPDDVQVTDDTYYGDLKSVVYFAYGTPEQSVVYVENGKFTPKQDGVYTAIFTARDGFGNVGETSVSYTALQGKPFTYEEKIQFTSLSAGGTYTVEPLTVAGLNGTPDVEISITDPLGEKVDLSESVSFIPDVLGEYTVSYRISDGVYVETYSYKVVCNDTDGAVIFRDGIALPRYFIKGSTYELGDYYAYKPTETGAVANRTDVYVKADGAEYVKVQNTAAYTVTAQTTLQFKYVFADKYVESEVIPVRTDIGYGTSEVSYLKYFVGNYTTAQAVLDSFTFTFDGSVENGQMDFVAPILFDKFQINFKILEACDNFDSVQFVLTDYANS